MAICVTGLHKEDLIFSVSLTENVLSIIYMSLNHTSLTLNPKFLNLSLRFSPLASGTIVSISIRIAIKKPVLLLIPRLKELIKNSKNEFFPDKIQMGFSTSEIKNI